PKRDELFDIGRVALVHQNHVNRFRSTKSVSYPTISIGPYPLTQKHEKIAPPAAEEALFR
ncbi:MAG: hypothetical protein ACFFCW_40355, partial [Candidatus Hodarchaeota archaeon]